MLKQAKPIRWKKLHSTTLLSHPRMTIVEDDVEGGRNHVRRGGAALRRPGQVPTPAEL